MTGAAGAKFSHRRHAPGAPSLEGARRTGPQGIMQRASATPSAGHDPKAALRSRNPV